MTDFIFKVCIFGDGGVGKTTLTQRFLTGIFKERYQLSIGTDFYIKKMTLDDSEIKLQIWDFAGEEKFRFLMPNCLANAQAAIFMYDITRYNTFKNLDNWYKLFKDINLEKHQEVFSVIVGGKLDLEELRAVPKEKGLEIANQNGAIGWIECSSKSNDNIENIFEGLARVVLRMKLENKKPKKMIIL